MDEWIAASVARHDPALVFGPVTPLVGPWIAAGGIAAVAAGAAASVLAGFAVLRQCPGDPGE